MRESDNKQHQTVPHYQYYYHYYVYCRASFLCYVNICLVKTFLQYIPMLTKMVEIKTYIQIISNTRRYHTISITITTIRTRQKLSKFSSPWAETDKWKRIYNYKQKIALQTRDHAVTLEVFLMKLKISKVSHGIIKKKIQLLEELRNNCFMHI